LNTILEKEIRYLILLLLLPCFSHAQWEQNWSGSGIALRSESYSNSNALSQRLLNSVLFDIELSEQDLERNLNRIRNRSHGGLLSIQDLTYSLSWNQRMIRTSFRDHRYGSFRTSGQALELALLGNSPFENDTLDLGPTNYRAMSFQELFLGIELPLTNGNVLLGVSYLNAGSLQQGNLSTGKLYTAPYGSYLWADVEGDFYESDTLSRGLLPSNAHGFSVSAMRTWSGLTSNASLQGGIQNLGFVAFNEGGTTSKIDRQYRMDPIVYDLSKPNERIASIRLQDTLNRYSSRSNRNRVFLSPFRIDLNYSLDLNRAEVWTGKRVLGLQYIYLPGYIPRFFYREYFRFGDNLQTFASTGFGGFGSLFFGLGFNYSLDGLKLQARLSNLEGLALPSYTAGLGASLQLSYTF
jgi:hypothetical protein